LNLGTGTGSSVLEVIRATEETSGRPVPFEFVPRREGDPVTVFADPSLVRGTLDWMPQHGLDAIIASAWQWHSTHLDGFTT